MADEKQYISRIKLVDGTTVDVKDTEARQTLQNMFKETIFLDCGTALEEI